MPAIDRVAAAALAALVPTGAVAAPPNIFFLSNVTKVDVSCSISLEGAGSKPAKVLIGGGQQWIDQSVVGTFRVVTCRPPVLGNVFRLKRGQRYVLLRRPPASAIELVRVAAEKH